MDKDTQTQSATQKVVPCACTAVLGALVIVFAWWDVRWSAIALTILGALIIIRGLVNQCCCSSAACSSASENESASAPKESDDQEGR